MPTALTTLFCTDADVDYILSEAGHELRLDDDSSGFVEATEAARRLQARSYATTRVLFYCVPRYDASELEGSWLVNEWAAVIAARWLCTRRGNPPPKAIQDLYEETLKDLEDVRADRKQIPDAGTRNVGWPTWSNVRVDHRYNLRKLRVERPLSERTPAQSPQSIDRGADFIAPAEEW